VAVGDFNAEVELLVELARADLDLLGGTFKKRLDEIYPQAAKGLLETRLLY
jgi:hypothetical protein